MELSALRQHLWVACRAPSAHNTQPWLLIDAPEGWRLEFSAARHLSASDAGHRDLLLSLGAFVESLLIVAAELRVSLQFEVDVDLEARRLGSFTAGTQPYRTAFRSAHLLSRRTSRLPFEPLVPHAALQRTLQAELNPGESLITLKGAQLHDLLVPADEYLLDTPGVAREFHRWFRACAQASGPAALDGLTAECLGLGRLQSRTLSMLLSEGIYPWFRRSRLPRLLARTSSAVLRKDTCVMALVAEGSRPADTLAAGRTLQRLWLALTAEGIHTHPLSQILDYPSTAAKLPARLSVGEGRRILSLFRVGRSARPAVSWRLGETFAQRALLDRSPCR